MSEEIVVRNGAAEVVAVYDKETGALLRRCEERLNAIEMLPKSVPLMADPKMVDAVGGLALREAHWAAQRRKWMKEAAGALKAEPMMPVLRRPTRSEEVLVFPDRHPRLHRLLRRFGLYQRRQLQRLDAFYERTAPTKPGRTTGRGAVDSPGRWEMR